MGSRIRRRFHVALQHPGTLLILGSRRPDCLLDHTRAVPRTVVVLRRLGYREGYPSTGAPVLPEKPLHLDAGAAFPSLKRTEFCCPPVPMSS